MMRHDPADIEYVLRSALRDQADSVPAPDLWPSVRSGMSSRRGAGWLRMLTLTATPPRWLAPAGAIALAMIALIAWVMFIDNSADKAPAEDVASQSQGNDGPATPVGAEQTFIGALRSLESAGPFKMESESSLPDNTGGMVSLTWPAYSEDSLFWQTYPGAAAGDVPGSFGMGSDFESKSCETFGVASICDRVWIPSGETLGHIVNYGGVYKGAGIFVSPDLYRTRRKLVLNPGLQAEMDRRGATAVSSMLTVHDLRQEDGQLYVNDGIKRSPSPFAEVDQGKPNEGSFYGFLMMSLTQADNFQFQDFPPTDIVDAANFSGFERVTPAGETDGDGLIEYRAATSGFLGETGVWSMWISPDDGLPRRIHIESFSAARDANGPLRVTTATLKLSRFGEGMGIYSDLLLFDVP